MAIIFNAHDLTVRFGKYQALQNASMTAHAGEIIALLGPNGAGKTTFIKAALGLIKHTGTVEINGPVGILLDDGGLIPGLTGQQYLHSVALFHHRDPSEITELLDTVQMTHAAHRKIKNYSLGMKRRIALAAALIPQPKLLILDEPANGLDPEGIRWLTSFLRQFAANGNAVVVSTHLLKEAADMSTHTTIIRDGHTVYSGETSDNLENNYFATTGATQS